MDAFTLHERFIKPLAQQGKTAVECARVLAADVECKNLPLEIIIEAMAGTGYPAEATLRGGVEFVHITGGESKLAATVILLKKMNYPDNEIENALQSYISMPQIKSLLSSC